jgi:hypothetical protein
MKNRIKTYLLYSIILTFTQSLIAKVNAQSTDLSPNGVLVSRLTTVQRDALIPTLGQLIYNIDTNCFNVFQSNGWQNLCGFNGTASNVTQQGNTFNGASQLLKLDANGDLNISGKIVNESYIAPSLLSNWVNYGAGGFAVAGYYKDKKSMVWFKGIIKNGFTVPYTTILFTLPTGYRPAERLIFSVVAGLTTGRIDILPNGEVAFVSGSNIFMSLDGIAFRADGN